MPKSRSRRRPQQRPARPGSARPSAPAAQVHTGLRGAVERRSAIVLVWLSRQPKVLLPLVSVALLLGGLVATPAVGVPLLLLLLVLVGWLTYLSWPAVQGRARLVRGLTLGLLVAAVVTRVG